MRRFRDLLRPTPLASPKDQQDRASAGLAAAVEESHMRWWRKGESVPHRGKCLLLAVAPYSQYDLTLLDLIDEALGSRRSHGVEVYVVNVGDYDRVEQLAGDFPGIGTAMQTPLAAVWEDGSETIAASGKRARDLVAVTLGLSADLGERIKVEAPGHSNAAG